MKDEDPVAIWRALTGKSDNNFHIYTEVTKGEESDVDLDIVVRGGILQLDNELSEDNSTDNGRGDERDSASDADDLPVPHAPRKCKQAGMQKTKKAKVDVSWADQTKMSKLSTSSLPNLLWPTHFLPLPHPFF